MRHYCFILLAVLVITPALQSQTDTINQFDPTGKRTGYWEKHYPNGKLQYQGYFDAGVPVGKLSRYYPDGTIKAILSRHPDSTRIEAELFDETGTLRAKGPYLNQKKDGLWQYLSTKGNTILTVNYQMDKLHGQAIKFHINGIPQEKTNWVNHKQEGLRTIYSSSGKVQSSASYRNNRLDGAYKVFNDAGFILVNGRYQNNRRVGKWQYFDQTGKLAHELYYENGQLQNPEVLDAQNQKLFELYEKNKGKLKDPMDYLDDPFQYIK